MSKKIHKIMACVDFSDYTQMVLEYAVELALDSKADILIYNVINQRDVNIVGAVSKHAPDKISAQSYVDGLVKDRQELIDHMINTHFMDEKSRMHFQIDMGIPHEKILEKIETDAIDLVVMANLGRGNIERMFFGSAAEKVFRHSPVPVVSVRNSKLSRKER